MLRFTALCTLLALTVPALAQQAGTDTLTVTCDEAIVAVVTVAADGTLEAVLREGATCRAPLTVVEAPTWSVSIDHRREAPVVVVRGGDTTWRAVADVVPARAAAP